MLTVFSLKNPGRGFVLIVRALKNPVLTVFSLKKIIGFYDLRSTYSLDARQLTEVIVGLKVIFRLRTNDRCAF